MTATTIRVQMAQRKDTAANWTAANPILLSGEIGYETDTKKFKIGNGSTNWNSLAYLPIPDGSGNLTITGNLEIGSTGSLTFEGSTADGFETTLAVTNPTADRTITLPNQSGTVLVSGNASIVDADIAANAEIAVSKLADGTARQLLQTDAAGTGVEWTSNVDIPGTLDVTGTATFDGAVTIAGDLTVNGTTTTISTQNLLVEDKNIIIGDVATPTDVTADGGGITLKGATDKTINWVDATDAWTSSERFSVPLGSAASPSLTFTSDPNTGLYSPGADQVAISTGGSGRLFVDASGNVAVGTSATTFYGGRLTILGGALALGAGAKSIFWSPSDNGSGEILSPAQNALAFNTNSTERLRITSAGLVGVGTSSPSSILHVNAGAGFDTNVRLQIGAAGSHAKHTYSDATNTVQWTSGYRSSTNTFGINVGDSFNSTGLTIDSSGRLGVGTTSPGALFHLAQSAADAVARIDGGSSSTAFIDFRIAGANKSYVGLGGLTGGSNNDLINYNSSAGNWIAYTNGSERLRIDSSGRLLVGTSSALSNLYDQATSYTPNVQFASASQSYNAGLSLINYSGLGYPATLTLGQSGSNTLNTNALVGNGNCVGSINFVVNDGTNFRSGATVQAFVDGASGSGDIPTRLVFSTTADGASSPTERLRINNQGGISGFAEGGWDNYVASNSSAAGTSVSFYNGRHSATGTFTGTNSYYVWTNGNVQNTNGSYTAISDAKLKENIVDAGSQWNDLKAIRIRNWNFKAETGHETHRQIGPIAQELETVCPGLVFATPDRDEDGNETGEVTKGVNQSVLYMKAVKALQEAMERIETLEAKVAALESA